MERKHLFANPTGFLSKNGLKARLLVVLLTICSTGAYATAYSQASELSIKMENASVSSVLDYITKNSEFTFFYDDSILESLPSVTINSNETTVKDVLVKCFEGSDIKYVVKNKTIVLSKEAKVAPKEVAQVKEITINGKIVDEKKKPVVGATVIVLGTSTGAITDQTGSFIVKAKEGSELEVSFIGYITAIQKVTAAMTSPVIEMKADAFKVEDVVVVGYGTTAVKDFTGSVARITAKDIGVKNVAGASALMQNVAAGVQVSQPTGRPGETSRIRVRGATSLSGSNDPLYVIDGVPTDDVNMFDAIPPSDIASIDVLKDASASAIYGSRAANGVVLVTTKNGQLDRKATFNVDYTASHDMQIENFRMLEGDEYREYLKTLSKQTLVYDPTNATAKSILDPNSGFLGTANTDWFEEVKQPAWRSNLNVSASGGSKAISYYISGSVQDHKGMVIDDNLTRYVGRVNLDANISDRFKVGTKLTASYEDNSKSGTSLHSSLGFRPDLPVYNEDGSYYKEGDTTTPVANLEEITTNDNYRFTGTIYGELEIVNDLKLRSSLSGSQYMNNGYNFTPSFLDNYDLAKGQLSNGRGFSTIWDNTLSYKKLIGNHSIDALVGVSFENVENQSFSFSKEGYALDEIFINVDAGTDYASSSEDKTGRGLLSTFFRANYKYKDKYLATFTARYDGSSMFGKNNRYGFFPSGALGWRINKESFLENASKIDNIMIKVSAGRTGVQNMQSYANRDLYSNTTYNGNAGLKHSQIGNPDIAWEQSTLYDAAVDFAFFGHKLSGSFGYYRKDTNGLIWDYSFPSSMAVGSMKRNIGSVRNEGLELNLRGIIIDRDDLSLVLNLNLSHNKNEVIKLEKEGAFISPDGTIMQGTYGQVLAEGYPMGAFLGYEHNGIIQNQERVDELNAYAQSKDQATYNGTKLYPGMLEYKDLNGDGRINSDDQTIIGTPDPDLYGGLGVQFGYKKLSVDLDFGFQIGGTKVYNRALQNVPAQLSGLVDYNLYNVWSPTNTSSEIPVRYIEQGVPSATNLQLYDASYFRLQNVRISYDLPKYTKLNMNSSIFISATNLFTLTSYPGTDPATVGSGNANFGGNGDGSYPGIRTISFGAKLNF